MYDHWSWSKQNPLSESSKYWPPKPKAHCPDAVPLPADHSSLVVQTPVLTFISVVVHSFFLEKEFLDIKYCTFLSESLISCLYILCITWLNSSEEDYNCCVNSHFNPLSQVLGLNWMTWLDIWPYVKTIEVEHWRMLWQLGWLLWDVSPEWLEEKQDIYLGADDGIKVFWITSFKSMGVNKTML